VRAYTLIVDRGAPRRPYNICTGRAIEIGELLERLLSRARVKIVVKPDPARMRPNDTPILVGDPRRARDELGWTPEIAIDRTLDDLLDYWRGRPQ
jgi:GDP-4-dehydro-6-deoxy-D-mannose reductase